MFKDRVKLRKFLMTVRLIFILIAGGIIAVIIAGGLNELFELVLKVPSKAVSPFVEEPMKMAPLIFWVLLFRVRIKKYRWIAWGMFAGSIFAIVEAYGYIFEKGVDLTVRILPAIGHIVNSGIVSIGFIYIPNISLKRGSLGTRFKRTFKSISSVNFLAFLAVGITLHAYWNLLYAGFPIELKFSYTILCAVILFSLAKISLRKHH